MLKLILLNDVLAQLKMSKQTEGPRTKALEKLKKRIKTLKIDIGEDTINLIATLPQLKYMNIDLLALVIKHIEETNVQLLRYPQLRTTRNDLINIEQQSEETKDEYEEYIADFIEEFLKPMEKVVFRIDFTNQFNNLDLDSRAEFLDNTVLYYYSLRDISESNLFSKTSLPDMTEDGIAFYQADAIRYTKTYMDHVYDFRFTGSLI